MVVGVNAFTETEPNPLTADLETAVQSVDPAVEGRAVAALQAWRAGRDAAAVEAALAALRDAAKSTDNLMPATLACARAGVTTGEWSQVLREVFGSYRAATGVSGAVGTAEADDDLLAVRELVRRTNRELGHHGCGCWSASPAWTGTPTGPSRSPCAPATPASRWSTRASG